MPQKHLGTILFILILAITASTMTLAQATPEPPQPQEGSWRIFYTFSINSGPGGDFFSDQALMEGRPVLVTPTEGFLLMGGLSRTRSEFDVLEVPEILALAESLDGFYTARFELPPSDVHTPTVRFQVKAVSEDRMEGYEQFTVFEGQNTFYFIMVPDEGLVTPDPRIREGEMYCPGAPTPRFDEGMTGFAPAFFEDVPVYAEPDPDTTVVATIPGGATFTIIGGPLCALEQAWWQVETDFEGAVGWISDGQADAYTVFPLEYDPFPTICPGAPPSRLSEGEQGRVIDGLGSNNLRDAPNSTATVLTEIPDGATFDIFDGPFCDGGYAWWSVGYNEIYGWTAEGSGDTYWLEPVG